MQNFDFDIPFDREVERPKRDADGHVIAKKKGDHDVTDKDGKVVPAETFKTTVREKVRGRVIITDTYLSVINAVGEEVVRVVANEDGILDAVEGVADPDHRQTISGGRPEKVKISVAPTPDTPATTEVVPPATE